MIRRPLKILISTEFNVATGFGNTGEAIVDQIYNMKTEWGSRMFAPVVMALGMGMNPFENQNKKPYPVIPMYGDRNRAPFGQDYAQDLVRRVKPDIVLAFGDTWMIDFWNDPNTIPSDLRKTFKLIGYSAIDGYPIPGFWVDIYKKFDKILTFTKFGQAAIEERAKEKNVDLKVGYVYHGTTPHVFKPLPASEVDNYKAQRGLAGKKIIGMFSRNQPRKHHPEFVEFARAYLEKTNNDPNVMFYFHCMENDAGWDLPRLIEDSDNLMLRERFEKYGKIEPGQKIESDGIKLKERFFFPGITNPAVGLSREHLNMMYNICDVHVLLTSGEGYGVTLSDSLSAGIPTFTNDYAASAEFILESGGGDVIKSREFTRRGSDHNFLRPHTDYDDAVEKVMKVLSDPALKRQYSKRGRTWAIGMSYDIVADDWKRELEDLYNLGIDKEQKSEVV